MENLSKKVGYLKGLMEGKGIEPNAADAKLFEGIVDLLSELSDRVEALDEALDDLNDYVESIDDDLAELEGEHGDDDDFNILDDDEDEDFDDAFGDGEDKLHLLRPGEDEDDEPDALAVMCPKCARVFFTAPEDDQDAVYICPHCGERVVPSPLTSENAPIVRPVDDPQG